MYLVQYISDSAYGLMWPSLRLLHHHPKLPVCHTDLEAKRDHRHVPVTYLFSEHDTLDFPATMGVQSSWESQGTPQNRFYCYNPDHNARTASLPATPAPGNFTRIQLQEAQTNEYWPRCQHYEGSMGGLVYGTSTCTPHVVSVPFRDGIERFGSNISRLQLGPDLFISSTGQFRETYNLIAEMPAEAPVLGHIGHKAWKILELNKSKLE
ncbi:hypothetical protein F4604DRAFT_1692632 [Suillus subluteus]|nr:hypothetical protein F4604DRAFT_1692632 [Suillus subluteus]